MKERGGRKGWKGGSKGMRKKGRSEGQKEENLRDMEGRGKEGNERR